jgi:hypothetical protein
MTNEIKLIIRPFQMGTAKESAGKVLEEASEAREAAQQVRECNYHHDKRCDWCDWKDRKNVPLTCKYWKLADEIADVIQASCNLAARYGINLQAAMERCEKRNRARGRYGDANTNEVRESSVGDTANRRWMDSDSGSNDSPTCACDRSGVVDSDGSRDAHYKTTKSPEEMSAEELFRALKATNEFDDECRKILGDDWCKNFGHCSTCRIRLLNLLKEAHKREVASLEYEKSYYKEKTEAYERDYDDAMRRITDLAHERDGLRRRLEELSDAGITSLHRLLRETLGEAKNVTHNARVYINKKQESKDERCGDCGSIGRDHGGDCGVQCAGEHLLSDEPPAQEISEREVVIKRLREIDFTQKDVSLSNIGRAVLGYKPTPWWESEDRAALRDKLVELLSTPGWDYCKTCELVKSDDGK